MQDIKEVGIILSSVSNLPAFIMDGDKIEVLNSMSLSGTTLTKLQNIIRFRQVQIDKSKANVKFPKFLHYVNSFGLSFLNIILSLEPVSSLVIGPFFLEDKNTDFLVQTICEETGITTIEASKLVDALDVKDTQFIQAWGKVALSLLDLPVPSYVKINTIKEKPSSRKEVPTVAENRMNEDEINSHYLFERELKNLVRQGDREKLRKKLLPKDAKDLAYARLNPIFQKRAKGPNPIRTEKNLLLTLNTLFRQALDDAGIPPIYIHSISEEIAGNIEKADSSETLVEVIAKMIDSYCNAVNNISLQNHSMNIVKVQRYIVNNIDKKISLSQLSELTNLDESYLCRLFKRECHMTINEYIQNQRINEAKWMLESSDNSIVDIAHILGFSTQSYFCSVFKKIVGVSPAKYRLNHGNYYKMNG